MTVTPHDIGTFLVSSESGRNGVVAHLVDLAYVPDGHHKAKPVCSCHDCFAKGFRVCKHVIAVVEWERKRLGI